MIMFPTSGYFKGVYCPFYQHGLCHRPYCHFKHAKKPVLKPEVQQQILPSTSGVILHDSGAVKQTDDEEDNVMKIVKNVPSTKSVEYTKRKQEEQELKTVLELIDKENREKEKDEKLKQKRNKYTRRHYSTTSSSDGEPTSKYGLVDAFYNSKTLEIGTFTSHNDLNSSTPSLSDITPALGVKGQQKRICECDDPDCSGFIEDSEEETDIVEKPVEQEEQNDKETVTEHSKVTEDEIKPVLSKSKSHQEILNNDGNYTREAEKEEYSDNEIECSENEAAQKPSKQRLRKLSDLDFFSTQVESNTLERITAKKKKKKNKHSKLLKNEGCLSEEDGENEEISIAVKIKDESCTNSNENPIQKRKSEEGHIDESGELSQNTKKKRRASVDSFEMMFLKKEETDEDHSPRVERKEKTLITYSKKDKEREANSSTSAVPQITHKNDYISADSVPTTGQGSGKKRVAHSSEQVIRACVQRKARKCSYVSPGLAAPVPADKSSGSTSTTPSVPNVSASMGFTTEEGVYVGKKRVAHNTSSAPGTTGKSFANTTSATSKATAEKVQRPKLTMEIGGKIPHLLRQRYLDKIIDEWIPKCESEKMAIEKGFSEEAVAHQRSSRKQIYMNLCANIIKRIRSMPDYIAPPTSAIDEQANSPHMTGQPTIQNVNLNKSSSFSSTRKFSNVSSQNGTTPKNLIKPVSSLLAAAKPPNGTVRAKQGVQRIGSQTVELTEDSLYDYLQQFILSAGQRWENGYPKLHAQDNSIAEVKDYNPSVNLLKRTCCRCGKDYFMNKKGKYLTREECRFHWGKLRKRRERGALYSYYSCCESDPSGDPCSLSVLHVCNRVGPLTDFTTNADWRNEEASRKVFSIDCEMCYTTQGLELTRVTVVDFLLEQTVDLFVKPDNPIVDYNTRFSGVTKEHLKKVDTRLEHIHEIFTSLFHKDTILMGHSLESDLTALKIIHDKVVDTALVFPHRLGLPFKRALRTLMGEYLQKIIQDGESGHDSCEDARACMELMKYKFAEDHKNSNKTHSNAHKISSSRFYASAS